MKFKVGDRVRYIVQNDNVPYGEEGVVESADEPGTWCHYSVNFPSKDRLWNVTEQELEFADKDLRSLYFGTALYEPGQVIIPQEERVRPSAPMNWPQALVWVSFLIFMSITVRACAWTNVEESKAFHADSSVTAE